MVKAVIFDKVQYLFNETKYNDHQLHCVIRFSNKVDALLMRKALEVLARTMPVLSRVFRFQGGESYWEDDDSVDLEKLLTVTDNENNFYSFTCSKTDEAAGPQIKACLLQANNDALSIVMNHMVTDAAGFKQVLYQLSDIYSGLLKNPGYQPETVIDGERGLGDILRSFRFTEKFRVFLFNSKDNNQNSSLQFHFSSDPQISPFILTHDISPDKYKTIMDFCKREKVTVNDVLLTVYLRGLARTLHHYRVPFEVSMMIDMRRYLRRASSAALTNLSSTVIVNAEIAPEESFGQSLSKITTEVNAKKTNFLGLSTFLKLQVLFKTAGNKLGYTLLKKTLNNPAVGMTNIGILDTQRLVFDGSPIINAYMCGSIKYRPHFQMAVSSFGQQMTLSVNLYGSREDRENIRKFFELLDDELKLLDT